MECREHKKIGNEPFDLRRVLDSPVQWKGVQDSPVQWKGVQDIPVQFALIWNYMNPGYFTLAAIDLKS